MGGWVSAWTNPEGESDWVMYSWEGYGNMDLDSTVHLITTKFEVLGENKEKLIHELDKLFTHGQMSDSTKNILRNVSDVLDQNFGLPLNAGRAKAQGQVFDVFFIYFT